MKKTKAPKLSPTAVRRIPRLVGEIFEVVRKLEKLFPGRHFTVDGHLLGSIGEVLAAHDYGLELLPASNELHDAVSRKGQKVQIKLTQRKSIVMSNEPEHMIVLRIDEHGRHHEVYNGPGRLAWSCVGKRSKNGTCAISLARLGKLQERVPAMQKIAKGRTTRRPIPRVR